MALNITLDEIRNRRENAIKLLNTHTDKYRLLYSQIAVISEPSDEQITEFERKWKWLKIESDSIHRQLDLLSELENCVRKESALIEKE